MSMMECAHCKRTGDARSMTGCDSCGGMVCQECGQSGTDCPGDYGDFEA